MDFLLHSSVLLFASVHSCSFIYKFLSSGECLLIEDPHSNFAFATGFETLGKMLTAQLQFSHL